MRCIARLWISAAFSTCLVAGIPMLALAQTDVLATCRVEGEGQLAACTAVLAQPSLDPKDRVEALLFHAEAIRRTGDKLATLKDLEAAKALAPTDANVLIHFAKYHYDNRELDISESYIRQAAEVAPNNPVPQNVWGKIYMMRDDFPHAIEKFKAAIALDPNHANSHWNLGNAYYKTGRFAEALKEYETCDGLYPAGRMKTNAQMMIVDVRQKLGLAQ